MGMPLLRVIFKLSGLDATWKIVEDPGPLVLMVKVQDEVSCLPLSWGSRIHDRSITVPRSWLNIETRMLGSWYSSLFAKFAGETHCRISEPFYESHESSITILVMFYIFCYRLARCCVRAVIQQAVASVGAIVGHKYRMPNLASQPSTLTLRPFIWGGRKPNPIFRISVCPMATRITQPLDLL